MTAELDQLFERIGTWLAPEDERDLCSIAVHECGHSLVAVRLGLGDTDVLVAGKSGVCVHRSGTALQNSAVSIAGIMAEALLSAPVKGHTLPGTKLTGYTLHKWVDAVRLSELSAEDRQGFEGHRSRYESARVAFDILSTNLDVLQYLAEQLAGRSREEYAQSKDLPAVMNEWKVRQFVREWNESEEAEFAKENLRKAIAESDAILASLPPVPLPEEFNFETFMAATGATPEDICQFCHFRVQRECWQVGLGAPSVQTVETAVRFFREHATLTRDTWIYAAREFCQWRKGELRSP